VRHSEQSGYRDTLNLPEPYVEFSVSTGETIPLQGGETRHASCERMDGGGVNQNSIATDFLRSHSPPLSTEAVR
jgi:hypothetical protein